MTEQEIWRWWDALDYKIGQKYGRADMGVFLLWWRDSLPPHAWKLAHPDCLSCKRPSFPKSQTVMYRGRHRYVCRMCTWD